MGELCVYGGVTGVCSRVRHPCNRQKNGLMVKLRARETPSALTTPESNGVSKEL